jgi:hypothetical protein
MNHEENDDLWSLLGKTRPVKVSSAFVQNALRAARMSPAPAREPGLIEWLTTDWNWLPATGAAAVLLFVVFGTRTEVDAPQPIAAHEAEEIERIVENPNFAVIANLDVLMAVDENDLWLDPSLR